MESRESHRCLTLTIVVVTVVVVALGAGLLALKEGRLLAGVTPETSARASDSGPAVKLCLPCGVIESIRSLDKAEIANASAVALRGVGADLMSVMAVVAGAVTGTHPWQNADGTLIDEITVRFEDGTSRVFKTLERKWERGDRVKVVQGRIYTQSPSTPSLSLDTSH